jgi:hypothetical protein
VDLLPELPFRPAAALPLPVDDPEPERGMRPGREADSSGLETGAEPPELDEQELGEVFAVVVAELEARSCGDCGDEGLAVFNVMQPESHESPLKT